MSAILKSIRKIREDCKLIRCELCEYNDYTQPIPCMLAYSPNDWDIEKIEAAYDRILQRQIKADRINAGYSMYSQQEVLINK